MIAALRRSWAKVSRVAPPWVGAALLGAWSYVIMAVAARVYILERFDNGIEYTTVTYLLHGKLPFTDFYEPYGIGLGIPGVLPHLLGFDGVFALRLVYGLFPALVTLLVTALIWRRCGAALGVLVGIVALTSTVPRYSMGFAALFGFALIVDYAVARTANGTLQEAAEAHPGQLVIASVVCSLAGWARTEYAIFTVVWAVVLMLVLPRTRHRLVLVLVSIFSAAIPTLIVTVTGGLRHLWWFVRYTLSSSESGFAAQRGNGVEWHLLPERLNQLVHLQFGPSAAGTIVGSYGVAFVVVIAGVALSLAPTWRRRLLARDKSYLTPFMIVVCAVVLYGQQARFSTVYGQIGNPVFWVAGALLVRRLAPWALIALIALVAYPLMPAISPGTVYDSWKSRPPTDDRVVVPGLNRIPMDADGGPESMAALISEWHALGLDGRATIDVELRNDVAWANDAIVGYLLDAPPAAWPLTYDPGLVNTYEVEHQTVTELCRDRAPVVQNDDDYTYPPGVKVYVGSRLLDEFLAVDYEVRAVAGFYRILLPATPRCELPEQLDSQALEALGESWLEKGELAEAGALAIARLERSSVRLRAARAVDASLAALGGYTLAADELPAGALGEALRALAPASPSASGLAAAAAQSWPSDVERLATQTAWIEHRVPAERGTAGAAAAVYALALRHADWPQAIANVAAIVPPDPALFATLAVRGAKGTPGFDRWRRNYFEQAGETEASIAAGLALVTDYVHLRDPVDAGQAELELATYPGVTSGCALALRRNAGLRPGTRVLVPAGGPPCTQPEILASVG
jgi:hypothetical protein